MQITQLLKGAAVTFGGFATYAGSQWLIVVAIARLADAASLGHFALAYAVAGPIFLFTNLQLRDVIASDVRDEWPTLQYYVTRGVASLVGLGVCALVGLWAKLPLEAIVIVLLVAASKAIDSYADVMCGFALRARLSGLVGVFWAVNGIVSLAAVVGLLVSTASVALATLGTVAGSVLAAAWLKRAVRGIPRQKADGRVTAESTVHQVRTFVPLGLASSLNALTTSIPRLLLGSWHGADALGIFAAAAHLGIAGTLMMSAVAQSSITEMANALDRRDSVAFRRLVVHLVFLALLLGVLTIVPVLFLGRPLIQFLYGPEYEAGAGAFICVAIATAIGYFAWISNSALICARATLSQVFLYSATVVVAFVSAMVLVPAYGILGAGFTSIITAVVQFVLLSVATARTPAVRTTWMARPPIAVGT